MKIKGTLIAFAAALFGVAGGGLAGYTVAHRVTIKQDAASLSTKAPRQDTAVSPMKDGNETSVIAVLVAYEGPLTLSTGQRINCFTPDPTKAFGDVFLFSVLVPGNLMDRLFVVQDRSGPMNRDPSRIFKIGTRYRFSLKTDILFNPWTLDTQYSLMGPGVKEAPITKEEVDAYTGDLNQSIEREKKRIAFLEKRIKCNANASLQEHYENAKSEHQKSLSFLELSKQKALSLLKIAQDDYPDVSDLKWNALHDEGWRVRFRVRLIQNNMLTCHGAPSGISPSISFQHPFNRAGGRTSNVRRKKAKM